MLHRFIEIILFYVIMIGTDIINRVEIMKEPVETRVPIRLGIGIQLWILTDWKKNLKDMRRECPR